MGRPRSKGKDAGCGGGASSGSGSGFFGGGGYSSHGAYMLEKSRKLKEQFGASAPKVADDDPSVPAQPPIFRSLTFWMTGRTCVPDQQLKQLIVAHGGIYEQYGFTKVSHIIADNLALGNQTWRELKSRVKRGHIVTSAWVLDCIREGRRIPEARYMPKCLETGPTMLSFFGGVGDSTPPSTLVSVAPVQAVLVVGVSQADSPHSKTVVAQRIVARSSPVPSRGAQDAREVTPTELESTSGEDTERAKVLGLERGSAALSECGAAGAEVGSFTAGGASSSSTCVAPPDARHIQLAQTVAASSVSVSRLCEHGLRGPAELRRLLEDQACALAGHLRHIGPLVLSVGLRVTVEAGQEWGGSADVDVRLSAFGLCTGEAQQQEIAGLVAGLTGLCDRACPSLGLSVGGAGTWAAVRHVSVQLRYRALSPAELQASRCDALAADAPRAPPAPSPPAPRRSRRWRRLAPAGTAHIEVSDARAVVGAVPSRLPSFVDLDAEESPPPKRPHVDGAAPTATPAASIAAPEGVAQPSSASVASGIEAALAPPAADKVSEALQVLLAACGGAAWQRPGALAAAGRVIAAPRAGRGEKSGDTEVLRSYVAAVRELLRRHDLARAASAFALMHRASVYGNGAATAGAIGALPAVAVAAMEALAEELRLASGAPSPVQP